MADINYIGGIPLGKITQWDSKTLSSLEAVPMAGRPASLTQAVDTLGVVGYINLNGRWTGTFNGIQLYIRQLKSVIDGYQTSPQLLRSPFINTKDATLSIRLGSMGIVTSTDTNKLIDSGNDFFTNGTLYGDLAKNLVTGEVATVLTSTNGELTLASPYSGSSANIFTVTGQAYAVTTTIHVKILNLAVRWGPPGLGFCDYELNLIQVA